jgi:protein-S-isoprenylcysteine O-methyltransferase Ste14
MKCLTNGVRPMHLLSERTISILATLLLGISVVSLYFNGSLFSPSPYIIGVQIAAVVLMLWARITFGMRSFHYSANPTPGILVTTGPYRFVRNPIYAAIWLFTWAGVAAHLSVATALAGLLVLSALLVRIFCEERLLREHFPDYSDYAKKTARLVPFVI